MKTTYSILGRRLLLIVVTLLFFILLPFTYVRVMLCGIALVFLIRRVPILKAPTVFAILLSVYTFGFLLTPYWNIYAGQDKLLSFTLLTALTVFLAVLSTSSIVIPRSKLNIKEFVLVGTFVYLVNFFTLPSDISYRGDEDFHMNLVADLAVYIEQFRRVFLSLLKIDLLFALLLLGTLQLLLISIFAVVKIVFSRKKISHVYFIILSLFFAVIWPVLYLILRNPGFLAGEDAQRFTQQAFRYPYLLKWFNLFFVLPQIYNNISLYRAVSLASVIFLVWFLYSKVRDKIQSGTISFLFTSAISLVPLLYFYTSLPYLEVPTVLLMTVCIFDVEAILKKSSTELMSRISFIALIGISFLKETNAMFLLVFLGLRSIFQIRANRKKWVNACGKEIRIWICVLAPLAIYFFFRTFFTKYNEAHMMNFSKLFDLQNYIVFLSEIVKQMGLLFPFGFAGILVVFIKRKWETGLAVMIILSSYIIFNIADAAGYINYVGYSRWNLFFLPIFFYGAYRFVIMLNSRPAFLLIALFLIFDVYLLPVHLDGARRPNWGSPLVDTAEYTYPYESAVRFISSELKPRSVLITGHYYLYGGMRFYASKYNLSAPVYQKPFLNERFDSLEEDRLLRSFFDGIAGGSEKTEYAQADVIFYHSVNNISLDTSGLYGKKFRIIKKISNSEHTIYVFENRQKNYE